MYNSKYNAIDLRDTLNKCILRRKKSFLITGLFAYLIISKHFCGCKIEAMVVFWGFD